MRTFQITMDEHELHLVSEVLRSLESSVTQPQPESKYRHTFAAVVKLSIPDQVRVHSLVKRFAYRPIEEQQPDELTCMCGDSMENHASPLTCGHSPVSERDHYAKGSA